MATELKATVGAPRPGRPAAEAWVPPLDVAVDVARLILDETTDDMTPISLAKDCGALRQALRQVIDAIDAEGVLK